MMRVKQPFTPGLEAELMAKAEVIYCYV